VVGVQSTHAADQNGHLGSGEIQHVRPFQESLLQQQLLPGSEEIAEAAARTGAEIEFAQDIPSALSRARAIAGENGIVVVTGSIYVVGEAMQALGVPA